MTQVVCCDTHTIALTKDDEVWTWGGGDYGQLGHGDVTERLIPTKVAGLDGMKISFLLDFSVIGLISSIF